VKLLAKRDPSPTVQTPSVQTFAGVHVHQQRLVITDVGGNQHEIPAVWFRDNCLCTECRIAATGEHRYFLGTTPELPDATSVQLQDGTMTIVWSDGHSTTVSAEDLATISHIADRTLTPAQPWGAGFTPARFNRADIVRDTATCHEFLTTALRDGIAIVTEMGIESGECIRFLEDLALPVRDTPFDRLHDVFYRIDGYNVAHTDEALPPHNDFASYTWPPSGQLIHMLVNEVTGGEWVNVDGFHVIAQLWQMHPDAFRTLAHIPIAFREHSDTAESWTREPLIRIDSLGNVTGLRFSNQLMQPMSPFDPDVQEFYEAYHLLARAICDPANQIEFRAEPGTMQFLHGHRVLHSRRAFDGSSGARHLQDTYFDFDDVASLVALMSGDAR